MSLLNTAQATRKLLVTGVSGQVGFELQRTLSCFGTILAPNRFEFDLTSSESIQNFIRKHRPDWIINPGAYTAVDLAEKEPDVAMQVNFHAVRLLAEEASQLGIPLIHFSTDYVFDGTHQVPYLETDRTCPINIYGQSKCLGENAILEAATHTAFPHFILRTSWVYATRGKNFLRTILKLAQERPELKIINDQFGAPTWARHLAELVALLVMQIEHMPHAERLAKSGIYHATSTGKTTWYEFAKSIIELSREHLPHPPQIHPIPATDYPLPAARPSFSVLSSEKLFQTFGVNLPHWKEALYQALGQ